MGWLLGPLKRSRETWKSTRNAESHPSIPEKAKQEETIVVSLHRLWKLKHMEVVELFLACYIRNSRSHFKQAIWVPEAKIHNNDMALHRCCLRPMDTPAWRTVPLNTLFDGLRRCLHGERKTHHQTWQSTSYPWTLQVEDGNQTLQTVLAPPQACTPHTQ